MGFHVKAYYINMSYYKLADICRRDIALGVS